MSQSHLMIDFPIRGPANAKALPGDLPPLMPDLATTQDDLGTVHFSRFMVVGDEKLLFLSVIWRSTSRTLRTRPPSSSMLSFRVSLAGRQLRWKTTPRRSTSGDWRTTGEVTVRLEFHADAPKPATGRDSPVRRLHEHGEALRCGPKRKAVTTGPPTILGWC